MDQECVKLSSQITSHFIFNEVDKALLKIDQLQSRARKISDGKWK